MHLRSLKKTRKDVSLHDPIGTDKEGNEITLIDILGSEPDEVVEKVQLKIEKSKIYRNLDILDEREKEVVVGRFGLEQGGEERTQREIAKQLGISRSYVSRIEKRALMKLYHEFYKQKNNSSSDRNPMSSNSDSGFLHVSCSDVHFLNENLHLFEFHKYGTLGYHKC
ncbi:hypothetical protein PACILC2_02060 [Paenibacillus cisolokensis]|uniref:HTH cro/C1-type domain-containing protein n=1 Tax=Paenibacillus cisolokensis TaxID=1658519 RepID=A0ABQ4N0J2_9BACL|nr:hypothetical protein PACILC2_02060 [Paenibacillus cisolokensis]